jgi:galactokinase
MAPSTLELQAVVAVDNFRREFGRPPEWLVAAPGRVNLIGEHVDYNGGFVLPMAIDRYCVIAGRDAPGESATIFSAATNERAVVSLSSLSPNTYHGHWSNYIAGVIAGFGDRASHIPGFEAAIHSTVPVGGGLSSSAAIEVATATLLETMTGTTLDPIEKAILCQKAEHEFAGVPCGIMDQFTSTLARADHLMLLDCRSHRVEHIPFVDPNVTVLIMDTNVKHKLSGGEYAARRAQCESAARKLGVLSLRDISPVELDAARATLEPLEFQRAHHVVTEIERTIAAAAAVRAGEWHVVGQLMNASHDSLRDDFKVSCDELDLLVNLTREIGPHGGVYGSRMTGGGFGGSTVSLVQTACVNAVSQALTAAYESNTQISPRTIISRPARGAHAIR